MTALPVTLRRRVLRGPGALLGAVCGSGTGCVGASCYVPCVSRVQKEVLVRTHMGGKCGLLHNNLRLQPRHIACKRTSIRDFSSEAPQCRKFSLRLTQAFACDLKRRLVNTGQSSAIQSTEWHTKVVERTLSRVGSWRCFKMNASNSCACWLRSCKDVGVDTICDGMVSTKGGWVGCSRLSDMT